MSSGATHRGNERSAIRRIALLLALLSGALLTAGAPRAVEAQHRDSLPIGAYVRATRFERNPPRIEGILESADSTSLHIRPIAEREARVVPRADIAYLSRRVEVDRAWPAFRRGAKWGAIAGVVTSVVVVAAVGIDEARNPCGECFFPPTGLVALTAIPFTAATTLVGGVLGVALRNPWERVPIR